MFRTSDGFTFAAGWSRSETIPLLPVKKGHLFLWRNDGDTCSGLGLQAWTCKGSEEFTGRFSANSVQFCQPSEAPNVPFQPRKKLRLLFTCNLHASVLEPGAFDSARTPPLARLPAAIVMRATAAGFLSRTTQMFVVWGLWLRRVSLILKVC